MSKQPYLAHYLRYKGDSRSGAVFSACERYRYALWRDLTGEISERRQIAFIGLNPSTADEIKNDPTVRRCINFAKLWGYDRFVMLNAYGFRATDPKIMKSQADPCGDKNDKIIALHTMVSTSVVCAWGANCDEERSKYLVRSLPKWTNAGIYHLGLTKRGFPRHPLYLAKTTRRIPFEWF